ncbi:BEM_HP_G0114150.mRNA.1.CDS.1 [Saccharomyces cerevisiae]|nr:BEM_HP_G0114150.mRNA.1.CDS.1 [Saccharomyces cerevisiae]CAI7013840.1 BEM_HP_G0114150.mRNA.1.CDS.1 [Saccharomyces cerevisiae]
MRPRKERTSSTDYSKQRGWCCHNNAHREGKRRCARSRAPLSVCENLHCPVSGAWCWVVVPASSIGAVYGRVPSKRETKVGARCLLSSEATSQKGQTTQAVEALQIFSGVGLAHVLLLVLDRKRAG